MYKYVIIDSYIDYFMTVKQMFYLSTGSNGASRTNRCHGTERRTWGPVIASFGSDQWCGKDQVTYFIAIDIDGSFTVVKALIDSLPCNMYIEGWSKLGNLFTDL